MTIILSNLNRFLKKTLLKDSLINFAVKWILEIPPHFACVVTLPCETLMSAKQAKQDKLQGSVATYLSCGEVGVVSYIGAQAISLERMKLDISNLVCRLNVNSTGITHVKVLQYGGAFRVDHLTS